MKRVLVAGAVTLASTSSWAQVRILSPTEPGRLAWTNSVSDQSVPPIYRIERAGSPSGDWTPLAVVTNESSISLTNAGAGDPHDAFFRVAWTNGEVWNFQGFYNNGLVVTGKLYFADSNAFDDGALHQGSWIFRAAGDGKGFYRLGTGELLAYLSDPASNFLAIEFSPYCCDNYFCLMGLWPLADEWSGSWAWAGYGGPSVAGTFAAQRIANGN